MDPDEPERIDDAPSKSARKREHRALQGLGSELMALSSAQLGYVPLSEELRQAVAAGRRLKKGARARHVGCAGCRRGRDRRVAVGRRQPGGTLLLCPTVKAGTPGRIRTCGSGSGGRCLIHLATGAREEIIVCGGSGVNRGEMRSTRSARLGSVASYAMDDVTPLRCGRRSWSCWRRWRHLRRRISRR